MPEFTSQRKEEQWDEEGKKQYAKILRCAGEEIKAIRQIHESVKAVWLKAQKAQLLVKSVGNSQIEGRFNTEGRLAEVENLLSGLMNDTRTRGSFEEERRMFASSQPDPPWWRKESISTRVTVQWMVFVSKDDPDRENNLYGLARCWALTAATNKEEFFQDTAKAQADPKARRADTNSVHPLGGCSSWCPRPEGGSREKN